MYNLHISKRAEREIEKLPFEIQDQILDALTEIKENPYFGKPLAQKHIGKFSYRVGAYRIIYKIYETEKRIFIFTAGHRSTVYK